MSSTQSFGKGGYNGDGNANEYRGGGGGATDLRKKRDDLYSRILVAAGGGAGYKQNEPYQQKGGDGGGIEGEFGGISQGNVPCIGAQNDCINGSAQLSVKGTFGYGASQQYDGSGAGWYGGGAASVCGRSGGSSYYGKFSKR